MTKAIKPFAPSSADFTLTPDTGLGNALTSRTAGGQSWPDSATRMTPSLNGSVYDESTNRIAVDADRILLPRGRYKMRVFCDAYPESTASALGIIVRAIGGGNKIFMDRRLSGAPGDLMDPTVSAILDISFEDKGIEIHAAKRTAGGVVRLQNCTIHLRYCGNEEEVG